MIPRKSLLTTQQTTYHFGALGNSGLGSGEERGFPSGKGRKKLFLAEIAFIGPFGSRMPQVRILSLGPFFLEKPPKLAVFLRFLFCFCSLGDCCFVVAPGAEQRWGPE